MKIHKQTVANKLGKTLAKPLSHLVANPVTERFSQLAEAYWCILLGKGAGTGWSLDDETKAAKSTIRNSSPTIFDIGANKGEWSTSFYQLFPLSNIFLFEPQPMCQKIINDRNIPRSVLIPNAVSSIAGQTIKMFTSGDTAGIASLHQRRDSYFNEINFTTLNVETVTIDDIIHLHKIPSVDFMKIDVEGHELDVLKRALKSLENKIIKTLSFEFGSGNINSRTFFNDFWDLLTPLGYNIFRILPGTIKKDTLRDTGKFIKILNIPII